MTDLHVAREGEAIDLICHRYYGTTATTVGPVLEANPSLAAVAHRLPAGAEVILPRIERSDQRGAQPRLWD